MKIFWVGLILNLVTVMDELKMAIINRFLNFHENLENGRTIKDYEDIKEAICLEQYITLHLVNDINFAIERATLNLRLK